MEASWNNFLRNFSRQAQNIKKKKKALTIIRTKALNYNTLRLGIDGYSKSLIAKPIDFSIFIDDLSSEINVSDDQAVFLEELWTSLELGFGAQKPRQKVGDPLARRYDYFGEKSFSNCPAKSTQDHSFRSLCLTANFIYEWLGQSKWADTLTLEAFAGYYNRRLENWCGLFEDLEIPEGSQGSFFRLGDRVNDFELIISNPPYQNPTLLEAGKILRKYQGSSISIIPDWRSRGDESIKKDVVIRGPSIHSSRRWKDPYPAFDLLRQSSQFQGVLYAHRMTFYNDFTEKKRIPEVAIIIVVLGSKKLWSDLVTYFG